MSNKKNIKDLFQRKGLLFPETVEEIEEFELLNPFLNETPCDWDFPEAIIQRGVMKLQHVKSLSNETLDNAIEELRMVARKGTVLPQHILDKMKANHKKK